MKQGDESNATKQGKQIKMAGKSKQPSDGENHEIGSEEPSLIQYRSKRRCVMEREKKKKKEWWEEENVLSDEEDLDDIDSDGSDNPKKRHKKKHAFPAALLPPPPNRIFVFSTELANRAAEAVTQGRVPSIVAYHRAQPQNQPYLRLQRSNPAEYMMNHSAGGNVNSYHYGNYSSHISKMEGMFGAKAMEGMVNNQAAGRPAGPSGGLAGGFNSMQQYQQYLKQQQQQEARPPMTNVEDLQQMLFGPPNGNNRTMFQPSAGIPRSGSEPGAIRPYGFPGHVPPGLRQQQTFMNSQREERFKFPQQQGFLSSTSQPPQQQQSQQHMQQHTQSQQQHQQQQSQQQQQQQQSFSASQPGGQQSHLPVLSPSSSVSSSSPLSSNIRSPPPYPTPRGSEANTLPGGSTVIGVPSPTNASSPHTPQTPHGPLTPRLPTSLASPVDGQRSPFSPGVPTTSSQFGGHSPAPQNIRDGGIKHAIEKPEMPGDKNIPGYGMMSDSRVAYSNSSRLEAAHRPNSLDLPRDNHDSQQHQQQRFPPPPNKSPFLPSSSPMALHPNPLVDSSSSHHPSKFSVESLTAPSEKERFYRPPFSVQGAPPYATYSQQPGLFYAGNKFPPSMLGQSPYQFPPHVQSTPQQFFPPNIPPNMYLPHGSFPIHHAGNREGGM